MAKRSWSDVTHASEPVKKKKQLISSKKRKKNLLKNEGKTTCNGKRRAVTETLNENVVDSDRESEEGASIHKEALNRLKNKDPEFYKFLEENDPDLINFNESDSDDKDDTEENDDRKEKFHKLPSKLEVDSDDSEVSAEEIDFDEETKTGPTVVTAALVAKWKKDLNKSPGAQIIWKVSGAIHAATVHAKDESGTSRNKYIIKDGSVFNSVMQLCVVDFLPAVRKFLKLPGSLENKIECKQANVSKNRNWKKIRAPMKTHLTDIIEMLSALNETDVLVILLRYVLHLIPFYLNFIKHSRLLLKRMVSFWSVAEESVRVLAFLCILRTVRALPPDYLDYILKKMYLSYVSNCKFTSPSTWPLINFMKRSLVELYSLDPFIAYQHAFVYIRQLAIHLRNAISTKKKDSYQAVYNWQFVHCLFLWVHLLSTIFPSDVLQPLIYPLTQVILGTCRLIPTKKYCPLRFHLVRSLTQLSKNTNTFIPLLPLILEALDFVETDKKHKALSMKPLDLSCSLKLSKSQLDESGFKNAVVESIYEHTVDFLHVYAHTISFPELVLPALVQLKKFVKTCKVTNYCRQLKQLIEKIEENRKFVEERRKKAYFSITDMEAIKQWENECQTEQTPLMKYYSSWRELKDRQILFGIVQKDKNPSEDLPTIRREELKKTKKVDAKELTKLFESDSDGEMEFTVHHSDASADDPLESE